VEHDRETSTAAAADGPQLTPARGAGVESAFEEFVRRDQDGVLAGGRSPEERRRLILALQRSAGNASVGRLLRAIAPPASQAMADGAASATAGGAIVPDGGPTPGPGQMRVGEFLDALKPAVTETARAALPSNVFRVSGCPWIEHWVEHYRTQPAADLEATILRYAPEVAGSSTAAEYIAAICEHVRDGIIAWETTGELPAAPAGTTRDPPGVTPPVAFKLKEGATPNQVDPHELQRRLGEGRPLDSSVRQSMGTALGADFSGVRLHDDQHAGSLVGSLGARALAVGGHVAFAPHAYAPGTLMGDALIAHELAHVVQQGAAPVRSGSATVQRTAGLESDADAVAASALAALHGIPGERGLRPALRSGLRLSGCYPRTVGHEPYTPKTPFDQPELTGDAPTVAPEQAPPIALEEAGDRFRVMEGVLTRLATHFDKDPAVTDAVAKARAALGVARTSLGAKAAAAAARISLGQKILDRCESNLLALEASRTKIAAQDEAERGRGGFLAAIDATRAAYVAALAAALSDGQLEAFNKAEEAGAALPRAMTDVDLRLMEAPQGDLDKDSPFRTEVRDWVAWMRKELDKFQADAETVAKAKRMGAPDLADREKRFKEKAELMDLSLRGLMHYDRASRAERILEGFKVSPGIQDDLVTVLRRGRDMYASALAGDLDKLRERVTTHEADPTVERFYRAVPAFKMASDFAASLGVVLIASVATAGIGGLASAAIGETATLGGTLLAAGGTAAIEALTFTLVSRGLQSAPPGTFLGDFAWNFGLFGILKGVGMASAAAAEAAQLPKGIGATGAVVVSFPLMHLYGLIRFRLTANRWPTNAEYDAMTSDELIMFLGVAMGSKLLGRFIPDSAKSPQLARMHSEYGTKFEALEIARGKLTEDYTALVQKGAAADKAQIADLQKKAQVVEDTFKQIKDEMLKDKKVDWTALKAELGRADIDWIEGSSALLAQALGVPDAVGLRSIGGDQRSYTYAWGKTSQLGEGLRAIKARVTTSSDPVSGRKILTVTVTDGEPPLTFVERGDPYPAAREVEIDPAAPEITKLVSDLGITDPAALRELTRMIEAQAATNAGHELKSHLKVVRRAISDALKGPEGKGLDANGYLKARAAKGALASSADPKLVTAATTLDAGGLTKTPEWLELRDPGGYVGLVGEKLAGDMALASAKPGETVLRNIRIVGDAFTDATLTKPATSSQGRAIADTDVVPELDLMTGEMTGKTFTYSKLANVKAVQPKGSGDVLKQAQGQNTGARGALQAYEAGQPYQRTDGTWVRIKKVTAIDAATGAELDLTGNIKAGPSVTEDTVGPATATKGKDATAWSQRLPYTYDEVVKIAGLLREMQSMKSPDY
jgi:hypothetical protein